MREQIIINEETKKLVGYEVGSKLHEAWRATRGEDKSARLGREPRWKKTKDAAFIATATPSEVVRIVDGVVEVDIANMEFAELPADWQRDNLEAGLTATRLTMQATGKEGVITPESMMNLSSEELEKLGDAVHEAWMARTEKGDWNAAQFVPYSELPREEQVKDLEHIRVALETLKEIFSGELTLEALRTKYPDMDKNKQH